MTEKRAPRPRRPAPVREKERRVTAEEKARRTDNIRRTNPKNKKVPEVVMLSQIADLLSTHYKLTYPIAYMTPYDWWRKQSQGRIWPPFPEPVTVLVRSPLFRAEEIVEWYPRFKEWGVKSGKARGEKAQGETGKL